MSQGWSAALWRWMISGLVHGSLLYGGAISLLHVTHNRMPSVRDALVLLLVSSIVYGTVSSATFLASGTVGHLAAGLLSDRLRARWLGRTGSAGAPLVLPVFTYTFLFWFLYFNFALSYDEVPFVEDPDIRHMLVVLSLRTLLVGVGSWLVARALAAAVAGLERRPSRSVAALAAAYLVVISAHVVLAWRYTPPVDPLVALEDVPEIGREESVDASKMVLIGIDGAEWSVINGLFEQGELPHLRAFVEEGVTGDLATVPDANSPLIWASIYTGRSADRHSIYDFYNIRFPGMGRPGFYPVHRTFFKEAVGSLEALGVAQRVTIDRSNLRSVLLWEVAYGMGRTIGVVDGYYYSFPAPELGEEAGFYFAYGTSEYLARVDVADRDEGLSGLFAQPPSLIEEQAASLVGVDFEWQSRTLLDRLDRGEQPALVNLYTHEPDSLQHANWKWYQPKYYLGVRQKDIAELGTVVPDFYRRFDEFLGELLPRLEANTVVAIVSDHGHVPCILHNRMQTWHRHGPPGVVLMKGGPIRRGVWLEGAHVFDVFPTVLHLLGLPVPDDGEGEVLVDAIESGSARSVKSIPSYDFLRERFSVSAAKGSAARNEAELERLRNMGYI